ncbi:hypothetical protein L596_018538 [Steinernema carpocapsae]|uniref:Uncharacterized protein n=1 Tax=Steinernema carpocapsae TaxID=34508 RepID=A0A4U5N5S9_STECR|nr:hypothetical protein L596_018538 [Steinernema carpocapsae]
MHEISIGMGKDGIKASSGRKTSAAAETTSSKVANARSGRETLLQFAKLTCSLQEISRSRTLFPAKRRLAMSGSLNQERLLLWREGPKRVGDGFIDR